MLDNVQNVNGNNNTTAGRDLSIVYQVSPPIRFCEEDLKVVIIAFSENVEDLVSLSQDCYRINIEEKNSLNNLSSDYFDLIQRRSLAYFTKIERFLKDPRNQQYTKKYEITIDELQHLITATRRNYVFFDEIFHQLFDYLVNKDGALRDKRNLVLTFLHFMYWYCDIGKKA